LARDGGVDQRRDDVADRLAALAVADVADDQFRQQLPVRPQAPAPAAASATGAGAPGAKFA